MELLKRKMMNKVLLCAFRSDMDLRIYNVPNDLSYCRKN